MRRTALATAAALLLLTACDGDGSPSASPSPSVTTPAPVPTSGSPTASPTATSTWPAGCPSPTAWPQGAPLITAVVSGGKVTPAKRTYDVKLNKVVRVMVTSDVADEVHVHTYDRKTDLTPGCPGVIDFVAGIAGTVEVELEDAGLELFKIRAR